MHVRVKITSLCIACFLCIHYSNSTSMSSSLQEVHSSVFSPSCKFIHCILCPAPPHANQNGQGGSGPSKSEPANQGRVYRENIRKGNLSPYSYCSGKPYPLSLGYSTMFSLLLSPPLRGRRGLLKFEQVVLFCRGSGYAYV